MAYLEDIALHARPSPLYAWPEVAEEQEQQDSEIGHLGGHRCPGIHGNPVSTGSTADGATVQRRIESSAFSPLTALNLRGRAVDGSVMPTRDHQGGVVTGTGRRSSGLHDARGDGHEKQKLRLWYLVKSLAAATALVVAVMLVISQGNVCVLL